jgi:hypothetical protein
MNKHFASAALLGRICFKLKMFRQTFSKVSPTESWCGGKFHARALAGVCWQYAWVWDALAIWHSGLWARLLEGLLNLAEEVAVPVRPLDGCLVASIFRRRLRPLPKKGGLACQWVYATGVSTGSTQSPVAALVQHLPHAAGGVRACVLSAVQPVIFGKHRRRVQLHRQETRS